MEGLKQKSAAFIEMRQLIDAHVNCLDVMRKEIFEDAGAVKWVGDEEEKFLKVIRENSIEVINKERHTFKHHFPEVKVILIFFFMILNTKLYFYLR